MKDSGVEDSEVEESEVERTRWMKEAQAERTRREEFSRKVWNGAYLHSNHGGPPDNI